MFENPYMQYNPYFQPQPQIPQIQQPRQEVTKVNGENGARAYNIGANSSALLLDESGCIVWLVTTDGAGYKTVAPFDITPHRQEPEPDFTSLEERITKLEERLNAATSNFTNAQQISSSANGEQHRADQAAYQFAAKPKQSAGGNAATYTAEESGNYESP